MRRCDLLLLHRRWSALSISAGASAAPKRRQSWRNGRSVTPAIGASRARPASVVRDAPMRRLIAAPRGVACAVQRFRRRCAGRRRARSWRCRHWDRAPRLRCRCVHRAPRNARGGEPPGQYSLRCQVARGDAFAVAIEQREPQQWHRLRPLRVIGQAQAHADQLAVVRVRRGALLANVVGGQVPVRIERHAHGRIRTRQRTVQRRGGGQRIAPMIDRLQQQQQRQRDAAGDPGPTLPRLPAPRPRHLEFGRTAGILGIGSIWAFDQVICEPRVRGIRFDRCCLCLDGEHVGMLGLELRRSGLVCSELEPLRQRRQLAVDRLLGHVLLDLGDGLALEHDGLEGAGARGKVDSFSMAPSLDCSVGSCIGGPLMPSTCGRAPLGLAARLESSRSAAVICELGGAISRCRPARQSILRRFLAQGQQRIEHIGASTAAHVALTHAQVIGRDRERQRAFGADGEHRLTQASVVRRHEPPCRRHPALALAATLHIKPRRSRLLPLPPAPARMPASSNRPRSATRAGQTVAPASTESR